MLSPDPSGYNIATTRPSEPSPTHGIRRCYGNRRRHHRFTNGFRGSVRLRHRRRSWRSQPTVSVLPGDKLHAIKFPNSINSPMTHIPTYVPADSPVTLNSSQNEHVYSDYRCSSGSRHSRPKNGRWRAACPFSLGIGMANNVRKNTVCLSTVDPRSRHDSQLLQLADSKYNGTFTWMFRQQVMVLAVVE